MSDTTPRLLINREAVALAKPWSPQHSSQHSGSASSSAAGAGSCDSDGGDASAASASRGDDGAGDDDAGSDSGSDASSASFRSDGFDFNPETGGQRDAVYLGSCDEGVRQLARLLGWEGELDERIAAAAAAKLAAESDAAEQ